MSVVRHRAAQRTRRRSLAALLDSLESRLLMSATVTSYDILDSGINAVASDNAGNVWAVGNPGITRIPENDPASAQLVVDSNVTGWNIGQAISLNPQDGDLYVPAGASIAGVATNAILQYSTSGELLNTFQLDPSYEQINTIAAGADGTLWFSGENFDASSGQSFSSVGHLDPATGALQMTFLPAGEENFIFSITPKIAASPDGSAWVSAVHTDSVGNNTVTLYHATLSGSSIQLQGYSASNGYNDIDGLAVDANGNLWYALSPMVDQVDANVPTQVYKINVTAGVPSTNNGLLSGTEIDIPTYSSDTAPLLVGWTFDPQGNLWLSQFSNDPATSSALISIDTNTGDWTRTILPNTSAAFSLVADNNGISFYGEYQDGSSMDNYFQLDAANATPLAGLDPAVAAVAGQQFSGTITNFVSSDAGAFSYTIDYGNGQVDTGSIANNNGAGAYTLSGTTTYAAAGTYPIVVTITSSSGDSVTLNGSAVVTASAPLVAQGVDLQGQKDVALAANVAGQSDVIVAQFSGAPAAYTATINWGDNTSSQGEIIAAGNNQYYVGLPAGTSKVYAATGTYSVSVVITDGTNTVTANSTATISAVPVTASQNLVLKPLFGPVFLGSVATFTADPTATAGWFKATIQWGDGSTSTGLVIRTADGQFTVLAAHIYRKKGTYAVNTNIVDAVDSETALATASIKIG